MSRTLNFKPSYILFILISINMFFSASCQKNNQKSEPHQCSENATCPPELNENKFAPSTMKKIQILNEAKTPLANSRAIIGSGKTTSEWINSDTNGFILVPEKWTKTKSITFESPGYVRLTLLDQTVSNLNQITLKQKRNLPNLKLGGSMSGIDTIDKDDIVDFGIAIPGLSKMDLVAFNIYQVMSPVLYPMSVAGFSVLLPENLQIPKQKESYFISLTLEKPFYNLFFDSYGEKTIMGIKGRFPFKKIISEVQNKKPIFELVNLFTLSSASVVKTQFLSDSIPGKVNFNVNQFSFDSINKLQVTEINQDQSWLAVNTVKLENQFFPTDFKFVNSGEITNLKSIKNSDDYIVSVLKNKSEYLSNDANSERMSISILKWKQSSQLKTQLKMIKNPLAKSSYQFYSETPIKDTSVNPVTTISTISELKEIPVSQGKNMTYKLAFWEIRSSGWIDKVDLPEIADDLMTISTNKRFEIVYIGNLKNNAAKNKVSAIISSSEETLDEATHISRAATDFK